jgi:Domain of unknown function (DUF4202)
MSDRLQCSLQAIDGANARDPTHDAGEPAEFIYGRRMSEALAAFAPGATEPLRIAIRGQHIERWLSPRRAFPEGKAGYFAWRNAAKKRHAERLGQIIAACGYDEAVIARVGALARKEQLRSDAEAQTLEDVACLVFLRYYAENFAARALAGSSTRVAHRRSDIVRSGSNRVLDPLAARSERVLMA